MTDTTEAQARAIAEALGWGLIGHPEMGFLWSHDEYGTRPHSCTPRITEDTTLAAAMQRDAIVWLRKRYWFLQTLSFDYRDDGWWLERRRPPASTECGYVGHVLEAAMIKELRL